MTRLDVAFPARMRSTAHIRTPLRIDSVGLAADARELASVFGARRLLMKAADPAPKSAVWLTPARRPSTSTSASTFTTAAPQAA